MAFPMKSEGPYSYAKNSGYQRKAVETAMTMVCEAVSGSFNARQLLSSSARLSIADLGCSVGPNTFYVVDSILEAVKSKLHAEGINPEILETEVFFNDQVTNDFNALFKSLPSQRPYYAVGVPGSFYDRLFPKASVHLLYSSYALHWLSKVPEEVVDEGSTAWNKGRIVYGSKEVQAAYFAQYMKDMGSFLAARAEELLQGGVMALLLPGAPEGGDTSKCGVIVAFHLLGSALMDMVKTGLVDEAKVDSFNFPIYCPSPRELRAAIQQNERFTIVRMEQLVETNLPRNGAEFEKATSSLRSVIEKPLTESFGNEILDELFARYAQKAMEARLAADSDYHPPVSFLVILKRK